MTDSFDGWMVWLDGWARMALVGERVFEWEIKQNRMARKMSCLLLLCSKNVNFSLSIFNINWLITINRHWFHVYMDVEVDDDDEQEWLSFLFFVHSVLIWEMFSSSWRSMAGCWKNERIPDLGIQGNAIYLFGDMFSIIYTIESFMKLQVRLIPHHIRCNQSRNFYARKEMSFTTFHYLNSNKICRYLMCVRLVFN